jgi:hypothetical protein
MNRAIKNKTCIQYHLKNQHQVNKLENHSFIDYLLKY